MAQDLHPTTDRLTHYIESPGAAEHDDIQLHLIECSQCRSKVDGLHRAYTVLTSDGFIRQHADISEEAVFTSASVVPLQSARNHLSEQQMQAYVGKTLTEHNRQEINFHLDTCTACKKALLHYMAKDAAMRDVSNKNHTAKLQETDQDTENAPLTPQLPPQSQAAAPGTSSLNWLTQKWTLWLGFPATALASAALVLLLMPSINRDSESGTLIAAVYQDQPVIWFTPKNAGSHGIGFFGSADSVTAAYQGVQVNVDKNGDLHFRWPPVEKAASYTLTLYLITTTTTTATEKTLLSKTTVQQPDAVVSSSTFIAGRRYHWELSGTIDSGSKAGNKYFTEGGFVISEQ